MQFETIRQRLKKFLIANGCKQEKLGFYSWFIAPNGHRFSIDARAGDDLIINHKDKTGKNRDFQEPLSIKNIDVIAEAFILWMLSED
jgi:hypothetical protein